MEDETREQIQRLYQALEIVTRIAVTALADVTALTVQATGADLLDPEFPELRARLREGMLRKLRAIFQGDPEDLLQLLRDFEGTIQ